MDLHNNHSFRPQTPGRIGLKIQVMATSDPSKSSPAPTGLTVHQASKVLEIAFDDGRAFRIPFELMRVYSPSAEVQGHGPGQEVLQTGKRDVGIDGLEAVGHYAVQPSFSDGHDTGIFAWSYLYRLGAEQAELWQQYLQRLEAAGLERDAPMAASGGHSHGQGGGCSNH